jgi:NADPH-dependent 2,4-dienoyl-CoA reductase/sulfur reductase-like enzyme
MTSDHDSTEDSALAIDSKNRPSDPKSRPSDPNAPAVGPVAMLDALPALLAPEPGWIARTDVVIVGSGIAGLTAALRIAARGDLRVMLVTKDVLSSGSTRWAQGGIAAALGVDDTTDEHLADTLVAGVGICSTPAVRVLVDEGPPWCWT